jgi:hypothetical protein
MVGIILKNYEKTLKVDNENFLNHKSHKSFFGKKHFDSAQCDNSNRFELKIVSLSEVEDFEIKKLQIF